MMREKTNKIYRSGIVHTDTAEQILDIFRTHLLNHPPRYFGDIDSIAEFLYFQYTETNLVENETVRKSYTAFMDELTEALGYDKEDVIIAKSGDVIELSDEKAAIVGKVHTGAILVDGLGVGDVGNIVLRDRQNLAENGIIIVVLTLEKYTGQLVAGPDIVTRGFVYVREAEELLDEARAIVTDSVLRCLDKNITDWSKIKNIIKDDLSEYLWKKMKRNPVILPIIMEAQM